MSLALCALAPAACQPNPVFMLITAGDAGEASSASEAPAESSAPDSASTSDTPAPTSTVGPEPGTTGETTGHVSPDTTTIGETGGTTGGDSLSTASTSSGEDGTSTSTSTSSDETTGQTTLDPMEACPLIAELIYYKLFPRCMHPNTEWYGSQNQATFGIDCGSQDGMAKALPVMMTEDALGNLVCDVLELVPYQTLGGGVLGRFAGLTLTPMQGMDAELVTLVSCKTQDPQGQCDVEVAIWVDTEDMSQIGQQKLHITNGKVEPLAIPLHMIPDVSAGEPFTVILAAKIIEMPDEQDRVYFIDPRIRGSL